MSFQESLTKNSALDPPSASKDTNTASTTTANDSSSNSEKTTDTNTTNSQTSETTSPSSEMSASLSSVTGSSETDDQASKLLSILLSNHSASVSFAAVSSADSREASDATSTSSSATESVESADQPSQSPSILLSHHSLSVSFADIDEVSNRSLIFDSATGFSTDSEQSSELPSILLSHHSASVSFAVDNSADSCETVDESSSMSSATGSTEPLDQSSRLPCVLPADTLDSIFGHLIGDFNVDFSLQPEMTPGGSSGSRESDSEVEGLKETLDNFANILPEPKIPDPEHITIKSKSKSPGPLTAEADLREQQTTFLAEERWPNGAARVWIELVDTDGQQIEIKKQTETAQRHRVATSRRPSLSGRRRLDQQSRVTSGFQEDASLFEDPNNMKLFVLDGSHSTFGAGSMGTLLDTPPAEMDVDLKSPVRRSPPLPPHSCNSLLLDLVAERRQNAAEHLRMAFSQFSALNMRYNGDIFDERLVFETNTFQSNIADLVKLRAARMQYDDSSSDTEEASPTPSELEQMQVNSAYLGGMIADLFEDGERS